LSAGTNHRAFQRIRQADQTAQGSICAQLRNKARQTVKFVVVIVIMQNDWLASKLVVVGMLLMRSSID